MTVRKAFKFCQRCGNKILWRQKRRFGVCVSCGYEVYDQPKIVVTGLLLDNAHRILLNRRAVEPHKGAWGTLGGFVEVGETAEVALRREIKEELGVRLGALKYVASVPGTYPYQGIVLPYLEIVFVGRGPDLRTVRFDRKEITALKYFPLRDIPFDHLALASQRMTLRMLRENKFGDL